MAQVVADRLPFWATLGIDDRPGEVEVVHLEHETGRLYRYTIALEGRDGTPSLSVHEQSKHPTVSLGKLYLALEDAPPGTVVPVRWVQPRWGDPFYVEAGGRPLAPRRDGVRDVFWILFTGMGSLLLFAGPAIVAFGLIGKARGVGR